MPCPYCHDEVIEECGCPCHKPAAGSTVVKKESGTSFETPEEFEFNKLHRLVPSNRKTHNGKKYQREGESNTTGNAGCWYEYAVYWRDKAESSPSTPPEVVTALQNMLECVGGAFCSICSNDKGTPHAKYCPVPETERALKNLQK